MSNSRNSRVLFEVRVPKSTEEGASHFEHILANLARMGPQTIAEKLLVKRPTFTFEIIAVSGRVHFIITTPSYLAPYLESQLSAQYPKIAIQKVRNFIGLFNGKYLRMGRLKLNFSSLYPLRTYKSAKEKDSESISGLLGVLSKVPQDCVVLIQIVARTTGEGWRNSANSTIQKGIKDPVSGTIQQHPQAKIIEEKINKHGFACEVRLITKAKSDLAARELLFALAGAFGVFDNPSGNSFKLSRPLPPFKSLFLSYVYSRKLPLLASKQYLNVEELASIFHLPNKNVSGIRNLAWGKTFLGEPPENLPVVPQLRDTSASAKATADKDKKEINFFGRTEFKNKQVTFGIKRDDRRRHMYIIGKTGAGKSTLIANMAINDMRNKEGLAVIDPHGDLSELILDYVPSFRLNDVVYLDPSDIEYPFHFNPLEIHPRSGIGSGIESKELIASGIVAIFYKLYSQSWGPRLEYILRNTILTLLEYPNSTLVDVAPLLTNDQFREKVLVKVTDPIIKRFWVDEFAGMHPRLKSEAIAPILNKIGQFVSSPLIRNIIGSPKSTIDLQNIMDQGKILILNLSQGKIGEDNAALLGAMFITKIQLSAMSRVYTKEVERKDFYLYVDEFQNFATNSFIKSLAEARKYRLDLLLANQYIGQINHEVQ